MAAIDVAANAFLDLTDTPSTFAGDANEFVRVNGTPDALVFFDLFGTANTWGAAQTFNGTISMGSNIFSSIDQSNQVGTTTGRFSVMRARQGQFVGGNQSVTIGSNGTYAVVAGRNQGPGTNTLQIGGGTYPPIGLFGNVFTSLAGDVATMRNQSGGAFMAGSAFSYQGGAISQITNDSGAFASFTGGYAYQYFGAAATSQIRNRSPAGFVWGYPFPQGSSLHQILVGTTSPGAFAVGRTTGYGTATLRAGNGAAGAFAQGFINTSSGQTGQILSQGEGAFAQGYVFGNTNGTTRISANQYGSFAQGYAASGGYITSGFAGTFAQGRSIGDAILQATGNGSFAQGNANANNITSSGTGSFAQGDSTGGAIIASAGGAIQFGPGTNAVANSLKVGAGFRANANGQHGGANAALTLGAAATTFAASSTVMTITGDAGSNTIATITAGVSGQLLTLIFVDALVTITDDNSHAANTIDLMAAFVSADDTVLQLVFDGTSWYEVSRSVN